MATIRPNALPAASTVASSDSLIVDRGSAVEKATPTQVVDAAIPLASQAEAEEGADNAKRVTPLRVKQAIEALGVTSADLASTDTGKGFALIKYKRGETGTFGRTAAQMAAADMFAGPGVSMMNWIDPVLDEAIRDGTLTDDLTTALQNALTHNPAGTLSLPDGTFLSGPLTVPVADLRIALAKNALLKFPDIASEEKAITVSANNFAIEGGTLEGPEAGVYANFENAIHMIGTSTSARKTGLTVKNIEIKNFRAHGIYAQFVDDIRIIDCKLHDCGYAGAMFLSCNAGWFIRNHIWTIGPGAGFPVMYGLSLTHDSTNYDSDPNAGTKDAAHPFCSSWFVAHNLVEDIDWEGVDAHGLYDSSVVFNKVYNTKNGIAVTNSSGDALGYAGWNNNVSDNLVDGANRDGTASGREWESWGINIGGGTTVPHTNVTCSRNTVLRKGVSSEGDTASILALRTERATIADNTVDDWLGVAIGVTLASGAVEGNTFGPRAAGYASDTQGKCISDGGPTTGRLTISDNRHTPGAGAVALVGFSQAASATVRPYLSGNRFGAATTPFSLSTGGFCLGTDVTPVVTDTASDTELDISALEGGVGAVHLSNASARTISTFTGAVTGQRITLVNIGAGTQTVDRTNARLDGAANVEVTQYDVLELYFLTSSDARQVAKMPSNG